MITLWHNPRCSKSRETLALIQASGAELTVRRYLDDAPDAAQIEAARAALGLTSVRGMMRGKEPVARALSLGPDTPEDALVAAMAAHPILIERPIVFKGGRAVIARPPEAVRTLL